MRRTRGDPGPLGFGALLLATALSPAGAAADDAEPIRVEIHAPARCSSAASFLDQVRARTPKVRSAMPGERARTFTVTVVEDARKAHGRLTIEDPPAPESVREVAGVACGEVVSALALITALAVDPRASTAPPSRSPSSRSPSSRLPPSPPLPLPPPDAAFTPIAPLGPPLPPPLPPSPPPRFVAPIVPPPVAPLPSPPRWRGSFGMDVAAEGAVAPSLIPAVAWVFEIERVASPLSPVIRFSMIRADSGVVGYAPVHSRFRWYDARVEACPIRLAPDSTLGFWPCAILDVGAIEASGWGRAAPGSRVRPWFATGFLGRIQWQILDPLVLELEGGVTLPLVRDTFYVAPATEVHRTPIVGGFFGAGAGVHFF